MLTDNKKPSLFNFHEKFQIDAEKDLGPLYILKSSQSLRNTGFLHRNPLMYLTYKPLNPHTY